MLLGRSTGIPFSCSKTRPHPLQRSGSPRTAARQSGQASAIAGGGVETIGIFGERYTGLILRRVPHPYSRTAHNGRAGTVPRRKVVLVLEDHASVGGLIAALLRQEGYRAVRAWDTQEALRLARGRTPDLVLLDLNLAYPDGLDAVRQVRSHEATRRAPIIIVAGGSLALTTEDEALVDGVVQKPFDIDMMLNAVRKALGDPVIDVQPRQYDAQDYFLHGY
jgi:CheY-like chemotaxis protein